MKKKREKGRGQGVEEEQALLWRCAGGDKAAWEEFVERYSKLIYLQIRRYLLSRGLQPIRQDMEDLYHSVFQALLENDGKKLRQFQHRCSLSSWIRILTTRIVIDHLRKQRSCISLDEADEKGLGLRDRLDDTSLRVEKGILDAERWTLFRKALKKITPEERLLAVLVFQRHLPVEDIAAILKISRESVYTRKHRLKEKLRKILEEEGIL